MSIPINWWAILVTVIVSFILGNLWYGPLFGKTWMNIVGIKMPEDGCATPEMKKQMVKSMIGMLIGSFLMSIAMIHTIVFSGTFLGISGISIGLYAGFWNWLGFIAPVTVASVLFETRPWKYWFITGGYYLVVLLINGMILASWM